MNNHNLLRKISYVGMIISGIGLILNLLSVFVFSNNLNGVNFKYGFEIPVTMPRLAAATGPTTSRQSKIMNPH